jgi:hypothetical protein
MHGVIFVELKKFVDARMGEGDWVDILASAGLGGRVYLPVREYPDSEAAALVAETRTRTGLDLDALFQQLGEFMAPDLLRMYGSLLGREWKTLEVIENAPATMHRVMRARNTAASPTDLRTERAGPDEVVVLYGAARRMCGLAKGLVRGLARHFAERIRLEESACMAKGAAQCRIRVQRF